MNDDELRGRYLAKLRLEKNLKQNELAKMIGYSDKSISKWERGKCFPKDTNTLIKLADILDVSIDDLLHAEYSDVEGKNVPHLKNKFLNLFFQKRKVLIIIFILIILLNIGYYIFVVDFKSSYKRTYLHTDKVEKIDDNLINDFEYEYEVIDEKNSDDVSNKKVKFDRDKINNVLINEGFNYSNFIYSKQMNANVFVEYYLINNSIKIYFYNNDDNELIILNNSKFFDEIVVEKYYDGKHEIEYIKNTEIKNCNLEKCESYLDYAMYINYIKNLILE